MDLFGSFKQLGDVALIMGCATAGTIGLIKVIEPFMPNHGAAKDEEAKDQED